MKNILLLLTLISLASIHSVHATHLRAGQITVKQQPGSRTCQITVTVFTNTRNTTVLFGGEQDELNFGDGTPIQLVPETPNTIRLDLNPDGSVATASFTIYHTFPAFGSYTVSYREPNRNAEILNMTASVSTTFYVESFITISESGAPYETPTLLMEAPVLTTTVRANYSETLACADVNNNQLYYQLTTPLRDVATPVADYRLPGNFAIDPISGLCTWDTKFNGTYSVGEYTFAVRIYQLKDDKIIGYMERDFQIILTDGVVEEPVFDGGPKSNERVYVPENTTTKLHIVAGGIPTTSIELQVQSELKKFTENFSYTIEDSTHEAVKYKVAKISLLNNDAIIRDTPYIISLRGVFTNSTESTRITKDLTYIIATKDIEFDYHLPEVPTGIEDDASSLGITVVPNPVTDFLQIQNKNNSTVSVTIHDLTGRTLQQQTINTAATIDLRLLTPGLYVCVLTKGNETAFYKIVKQ